MITLTCKSYRARVEGENVILEIDAFETTNLVPQHMRTSDVAARLNISIRKVAQMAKSGRLPVTRVGGAVRFTEQDVLRVLMEHQEPKARLLTLRFRCKSKG